LAREGVAASVAVASRAGEAGAGVPSSLRGALTRRNDATSQRVPSSKTCTSPARRSETGWPFRSRATMSRSTTWVSDRKVRLPEVKGWKLISVSSRGT
jgi:hypothetical protein